MHIAETHNKMQTFIEMRRVAKGTEHRLADTYIRWKTPYSQVSVWDQEHWVTPWARSRPKERSSAYTCGGQDASSGEQYFASSALHGSFTAGPSLGWLTAPGTDPEPEPVLGMPGLSTLLGRGQCSSSWQRCWYTSSQVYSRSRDSVSCSFYNRSCSVWHCNETVLEMCKLYNCNNTPLKCSITQLILTRTRIINFTSKK